MNISLRLWMLIIAIFFALVVTYILKRGRMPIKYALVWYFADFIIIITSAFPNLVGAVAHFFGFDIMASFIIAMIIVILIFINIILTIIISGQNAKIKLLIQEVSLLKNKVDNKEGKK